VTTSGGQGGVNGDGVERGTEIPAACADGSTPQLLRTVSSSENPNRTRYLILFSVAERLRGGNTIWYGGARNALCYRRLSDAMITSLFICWPLLDFIVYFAPMAK
jgi:hypothetical protein